MNIFKAYDIRGVYPEEIDEEIVGRIAQCFARMRQDELNKAEQLSLVVGQDMRVSSPGLAAEVKKALLDFGVKVIDVGLVSTPAFYFAVSFYGYDGGIMVSASHNPAKFNGLKLVRERALPFGQGMGMEELREMVLSNQPVEKLNFSGQEEIQTDINKAFVASEVDGLPLDKIKEFKIVVDTANGMGATYIEELIKLLPPIKWAKMNFDLNGNFPIHEANPSKEENLVDLQKRVKKEKADLGVAIDGDGDRMFFVDNTGKTVEPAIIRGILGKLFLRETPGAVICYDIRPGKITEDMIKEAGGRPSVTRVGHSLIKAQMIKEGAVFGSESSGHFFVKYPHGVYEAPVNALARLLLELSAANLSFSEYIKPLQKYHHSGEINFQVADREQAFAALEKNYSRGKITKIDGLTITYPDFWFNVRASNTEPVVRLNLEGLSEKTVKEQVDRISGLLR